VLFQILDVQMTITDTGALPLVLHNLIMIHNIMKLNSSSTAVGQKTVVTSASITVSYLLILSLRQSWTEEGNCAKYL